jgi:16S rRNA (uracil1498-N3)-methyltransferase
MSLPFFYEENLSAGAPSFILSEETSKHCVQVLRMKAGEELELTDGKGNIITGAITKEDKRACIVKKTAVRQLEKPVRNISIGISLLKNASRFEWFLEKATEIGVSEIIPLLCTRTERQHFRLDRMRNILIAAMLQSQQAWLPVLQQPVAVDKVITGAAQQQKLVAHCLDTQKQGMGGLTIAADVLMLIGPEGDFTSDEINNCLMGGFTAVTLGNTRLRTETAGIVAATLLANY